MYKSTKSEMVSLWVCYSLSRILLRLTGRIETKFNFRLFSAFVAAFSNVDRSGPLNTFVQPIYMTMRHSKSSIRKRPDDNHTEE